MIEWWGLLAFVVAIPFHEFGHYIAYRIYGVKPKIGVHWWGFSVGEEGDMDYLTIREAMTVYLMGIYVGFMVLIAFYLWVSFSAEIWLVYIMCSYVDLFGLYILFDVKKRVGNSKMKVRDAVYECNIVDVSKYEDDLYGRE